MFKANKITGFFLFFTILGSTLLYAQNQQLPQQQQKIEVGDAELSKFAVAFQQTRMIMGEAQQEMATVVQNNGLEIQRFNELYQAAMDPEKEMDATAEEREQYKKIVSEIEKMQSGLQKKIENAITEQGLSLERYEQIGMALQTDPELQERLKAEFEG